MLKNKINSLGEVLKKCEFGKSRLEDMFPKKHILKKQTHTTHTHTHKSQYLHSYHAKHVHKLNIHTPYTHHAFMYDKIYACTYCDRKSHLAKFYFENKYLK